MKRFEKAMILGLAVCVFAAFWHLPFARNCQQLREDTLRLHIIANSDSDDDQAVKLEVRDALLAESEAFLRGARSRDEALENVSRSLDLIEETARKVLKEQGFDYEVRAYVTDMYFEQRSYDDITLPAGVYRALRVELGKAEGHNWWCVVYPSLCVPSSTEEGLGDYSEAEQDIVEGEDRYEYRFLLEEWLQKLLGK